MDGARFALLLDQAIDLPESRERTALLEEAIRIADSMNDPQRGFEARSELIQSAVFSGEIEKAMVAFAWCIAQYDLEQPFAIEATWSLMWEYRWIIASIGSFPFISREKVHELEDDIIRRFQHIGFGTKSLFIRRWSNAKWMGDVDRMAESRALWVRASFDPHIECRACDLQAEIDFLLHQKSLLRAESESRSLATSGIECNRVPLHTLAALMIPLYEAGRVEAADSIAALAETHLGDTSETIADAASFVAFYSVRKRQDAARRILSSHFKMATETSEDDQKLLFLSSVETFLRSLGDEEDLGFSIPSALNDTGSPRALERWCRQTCDEIAGRFDTRNGNPHVSDLLEEKRSIS